MKAKTKVQNCYIALCKPDSPNSTIRKYGDGKEFKKIKTPSQTKSSSGSHVSIEWEKGR